MKIHSQKIWRTIVAVVVLSCALMSGAWAAEPSQLRETESQMREKRISTTNPLGLMDPSELPRPYESFMNQSPLAGSQSAR